VLPIGLQRDIMIISVATWLVCGCASPGSPHGAVRAEEAVRDQQPAPTTLDAQDVIALQSESDDGGAVAAYKIQRRLRPDGPWTDIGLAVESEITLTAQERNKIWEYLVIAVNKAGEGAPSNTVMAVL
jgi:hypothetical protein